MAKKNPERTAATKKRIENAFWNLYCNSEPKAVTAIAVAKEAGVNRSTFYAHFRDAENVLETIEADLVEYMKEKATKVARASDPAEAAKVSKSIFEEKGEFLRVFLGKHRNERIIESMKTVLAELVLNEMLGMANEPANAMRYKAEFIVSGVIGAYAKWLEDDQPIPIEEVASELKKLVTVIAQTT